MRNQHVYQNRSLEVNPSNVSRNNLNIALSMMDKHSRVAKIVKDIMISR